MPRITVSGIAFDAAIILLVLSIGSIGSIASSSRADPPMLLGVPASWNDQSSTDLPHHDGFGWYVLPVRIPADWQSSNLRLDLGSIDDADETFFDGVRVGGTGGMPPRARSAWQTARRYTVPSELVRPGGTSIIAVRVHDSAGNGGIWSGEPRLEGPDGALDLSGTWLFVTGDEPGAIDAEAGAARWKELRDASANAGVDQLGGSRPAGSRRAARIHQSAMSSGTNAPRTPGRRRFRSEMAASVEWCSAIRWGRSR